MAVQFPLPPPSIMIADVSSGMPKVPDDDESDETRP
jgi:hypothetical protein